MIMRTYTCHAHGSKQAFLALQVAFGEDGAPSKALQGFCRKNGVDPAAATVEGDYVWADVQSGSQSSLEVGPSEE